jgi:MoxR-like ATPase
VPSIEDVRAVAAPVLRHRVLLTFQAEADGITSDQVVTELLRH